MAAGEARHRPHAVRGLMSSVYVVAICEYWENEHFAPQPDFESRDGGERKNAFDSYAASVDWTNQDHVARALRVFERLLRRLSSPSTPSPASRTTRYFANADAAARRPTTPSPASPRCTT
jgi:hypothetical protein